MNAREKVSAQEFSVDTALDPEAIREAGRRATEAGTRFLQNTIREYAVEDSAIGYVITGPGGFVQQMDLAVGWEDLFDGKRRVTLEVGEFLTEQTKIYFIPIGPKSAVAMGSLKLFSARLRKESL